MGRPTDEVLKCIPQREPFLFVDEVIDREENRIITRYEMTGEEGFFKGHFPGNPIVPGVILQEATFQSGAVLMSYKSLEEGLGVVSRVSEVKFKEFVKPRDVLEIDVSLDEQLKNAFYMSGKIRVRGKIVMTIRFTGTLVKS